MHKNNHQGAIMSFQPNLTHSLYPLHQMNFHYLHDNRFVNADDPIIDTSHIHTYYEIYVNVSGDVSFLHNHTISKIQYGDIILSKPGEIHHCIYHSSCVHDHFCIWFEVADDSAVIDFINRKELNGLIRLNHSLHGELFSLLHEFENLQDSNLEFEKTTCFYKLLGLLSQSDVNTPEIASNIPTKMQKILNYINEHFANLYSVDEIASAFNISVPTLNRWFREYVHLSPYQYLTANKLSYSEKLLRTEATVTTACFQSGFTNCSRFISLFKATYGKTPLQYKKISHSTLGKTADSFLVI